MAAYEVNGMKSKEKRNKHKITVSPKFIKSVKWIAVIFALFLLIYTVLYVIGRYRFEVSFYQLSSEKVADKIRVIELADLHNWTFGKDNKAPPTGLDTNEILYIFICIPFIFLF